MTIREFDQWKEDYGLVHEPNYSKDTEIDCLNAFKAGRQSKQQEVEDILSRVNEALDAFEDGEFNYCHKTLIKILTIEK